MATTGVMRPGHIQLRVLDLDESVEFYKNVLGLVETGRDAAGRVYFKAWDERDHNSVILRQAEATPAPAEITALSVAYADWRIEAPILPADLAPGRGLAAPPPTPARGPPSVNV